jgi:hypothetical protein
MHRVVPLLFLLQCIFLSSSFSQTSAYQSIVPLENPFDETYLLKHLSKESPRLIYNHRTTKLLKQKIRSDAVIKNMFQAIKLNAESIFDLPLLEREMVGRRLLGTSREFLWRINMLALVYLVEQDRRYLARINEELLAVCAFEDWNPSHYLDVAEMALAVAIALDWTTGALPHETRQKAMDALIDKGIGPSWIGSKPPGWAYGSNNWNQVCNGGMIAASIVIAEVDPGLAAKTIKRGLDGLPYSLAAYGPDGVYPEGSTYWSYGTSYSVTTIAMLESAFGNDFGMGDYPAFVESAMFRVLCNAPSGWYYNFADCGDRRNDNGDVVLAWFATKTGNSIFFEEDRFLRPPESMRRLARLSGAALAWMSQYQSKGLHTVPMAWKGEGTNPIVIFQGGSEDPHGYYFGGKGGRGLVNHGNMDAGSFVFELNGVRWVIDPGNQRYHDLEKTGFDLWGRCQECERWTLLTKNNFGHSTLTVNDQPHRVDGMVQLTDFHYQDQMAATFEMTPAFSDLLDRASRTFVKESPTSLLVRDQITINQDTEVVGWQLLTQAEVEFKDEYLVLHQNGKQLLVENLSHPSLKASVIRLDPPPLELDRRIENLKRIEFRYPRYIMKSGMNKIEIRLSGIE